MKRNVFQPILTAVAVALLAACASPSAPAAPPAPGATVDLSMTLNDIYPTTFTGNATGGDDRNTHLTGAAAYMGVIVWIENNAGTYVKTVKYFLSDQKTTYGALYAGQWTHVPNSVTIFSDPANGMARKWTTPYSQGGHVSGVNGIDGVSSATVEVPHTGKAYSASWDLKDFNGNTVAAGTYKVRILVMRHSFKTVGSTEYSYSIAVSPSTNATGTLDSGFPLAQPGDATNATTENGVATGITVTYTHA